MSYAAWAEAIEDHFRFWSMKKMNTFSALLAKQYLLTKKRIQEWETGAIGRLSEKEKAVYYRSKEHLLILESDAKASLAYFSRQASIAKELLGSTSSESEQTLATVLLERNTKLMKEAKLRYKKSGLLVEAGEKVGEEEGAEDEIDIDLEEEDEEREFFEEEEDEGVEEEMLINMEK